MIVVSDTTRLNYLILIEEVEILHSLYDTVIIPQAVHDEMTNSLAPDAVRGWIMEPHDWIEIQQVELTGEFEHLDRGEREAIILALALQANLILIDEKAGRVTAKEQGLAVTGTLGVMAAAARQGLLSLKAAFDKLKQTSYRASFEMYDALLKREQDYERSRAED